MMCLRCGHDSPPNSRICDRCGATLPRLVPEENAYTPPLFDLEEGRQYVVPRRSFPTEYMFELTCCAYEYIHEEASGTPLLEAYQVVRSRIDAFESDALPGLLDRLRREQAARGADDYHSQMIYLLTHGLAVMREGFALMDAFIEEGDTEVLKRAVAKMQEGNDFLGLGKQLSEERARGGRGASR